MNVYRPKKNLFIVCACILFMGGVSTVLRAQAPATSEPAPGTRDYYEQKIKGSYAFYQDELLPINESRTTYPSRPLPPGIVRPSMATRLEGRILQVLSNDVVVIGERVTHTSGALTYPRSGVVTGNRARPGDEGILFRLLALSDGHYRYTTASTNGTLRGYREVVEPTYEEYQKIYERDLQTAQLIPIVSLERKAVNRAVPTELPRSPSQSRSVPPGLVRASPLAAPLYTTTNTMVTLPDTVTSIGPDAFKNCTALSRIMIPASVTRIDERAFRDCPALESILVDVLNPVYSSSADGVLFNAEKTQILCYPPGRKGAYTIPSRVTHIGTWAFFNCTNLTSVHFKGDAPQGGSDSTVFSGADKATVYYLPGTKGWGKEFGGRPVAEWKE